MLKDAVITVTITGAAKSGKSLIAGAIYDALSEFNIKVSLNDPDGDTLGKDFRHKLKKVVAFNEGNGSVKMEMVTTQKDLDPRMDHFHSLTKSLGDPTTEFKRSTDGN